MAPARKKSVNKRFLNEVSPEKEVRNSNKNKERVVGKRKLHNKLGPRWKDGELQRFYEAYRVHGADLKKIAAEVPNRSVEMVQALYRMNKVYLSLPEGIASVVGLIAMMTDHYSTLEVSDSERESNDVQGVFQRPRKIRRTKSRPSMSKEDRQSHSIASSDGYLSLLKKGLFHGDQPRAVGKRTPRIPISRVSYVSMKKGQSSENDANEEEVAHVAALALTEGFRRGGSPQNSCRRTEDIKSSPIQSLDTRHMEGFGTVEVHQQGKKFYGNKEKVEDLSNGHSDDGGEACSGTEGPKVNAKTQNDIEGSNAEIGETSLQDQKKQIDKKFSGDEFSALDALHALANISVMESESSVQLNEERTSLDIDSKSTIPKATLTSRRKDKIKLPRRKDKVYNATNEVEHTSSRKSKLGKPLEAYAKSISERKSLPHSIVHINSNNKALKRKRHCMISKAPNGETSIRSHQDKQLKAEVEDKEIMSALKVKQTCRNSSVSKQVKAVVGVSEGYCTVDEKGSASEVAKSITEVPILTDVSFPVIRTSRRKMGLKKALFSKDGISSENILKNHEFRHFITAQDIPLLKEKLSCCLSSPLARRWCTFEWFYSAIDYPWFAKREFVEYLNHVGLGHMPTLTRVEWGVIRSSLGKPRRFSENFLLEERKKLKLYRESVRKHYTELRTGIGEGLPTDLARPLTVGQRVIALHPRTRELKDGSVLTVDHDCCRVQFDCPELGVEFVKDIDCMPLNPVDNMPESLRRRRFPFTYNEEQANGNPNIGGFTTSRQVENSSTPKNVMANQVLTNHHRTQASSIDIINSQQILHSHPSAPAQLREKEVSIHAAPELNCTDNKNSSAFTNSRKHGTHHILPPWLNSPAASNSSSGVFLSSRDSLVSEESESTVVDIVNGSKQRAQTMIDIAVQAISLMKEGEDAFVKIGEALDSIDQRRLTTPEQGSQNIASFPRSFDSQANNSANEPKPHKNSDNIESSIPSELISSCVATLLMIQTCTERQYPPADVAQIIDSAVTSLHPCCSQNLPIYREIQMCMGRIKTQILALIPT